MNARTSIKGYRIGLTWRIKFFVWIKHLNLTNFAYIRKVCALFIVGLKPYPSILISSLVNSSTRYRFLINELKIKVVKCMVDKQER